MWHGKSKSRGKVQTRGTVGSGLAWQSKAWQGKVNFKIRLGKVRYCWARLGKARIFGLVSQARHGMARFCKAWFGMARLGNNILRITIRQGHAGYGIAR